jgi:transcription initiation factor TFIID TATA-box-binding protein
LIKIDLNDIAKKFLDVEYHPGQFPVVIRLRTPKIDTMIFTSGKMGCIGSKSEEFSRRTEKIAVQTL